MADDKRTPAENAAELERLSKKAAELISRLPDSVLVAVAERMAKDFVLAGNRAPLCIVPPSAAEAEDLRLLVLAWGDPKMRAELLVEPRAVAGIGEYLSDYSTLVQVLRATVPPKQTVQ